VIQNSFRYTWTAAFRRRSGLCISVSIGLKLPSAKQHFQFFQSLKIMPL